MRGFINNEAVEKYVDNLSPGEVAIEALQVLMELVTLQKELSAKDNLKTASGALLQMAEAHILLAELNDRMKRVVEDD